MLTRGSGSQHAIVILGGRGFLDLEDLASVQTNVALSISITTRFALTVLAMLWILLLITAAGLKRNTWFLLAIGGIGILQNILVAGWRRNPHVLGVPIDFVTVFGGTKVMKTLFDAEEAYPGLGKSMLSTFFPGTLNPEELRKWDEYAGTVEIREEARKRMLQDTTSSV